MDSKKKSHEVAGIPTPAQIAVPKKDKKRKNRKITSQTDELPECGGRKLQKNSDPREISSTERDTPMKKEEEDYGCLFQRENSFMERGRKTIFVKGFDCSFPINHIEDTLSDHFSSCGGVRQVFVPFACKTGVPLGIGFINMASHPEKALALNGSSLGGMRLEVALAKNRDDYSGFTSRPGCKLCANNLMRHRYKVFQESFSSRIRLEPVCSPKKE